MLVKVQFTGNKIADWFEIHFSHKDTVKSNGGKFIPAASLPAHWEMSAKAFKEIKEQIGAEKVTFSVKVERTGHYTIWISTHENNALLHFDISGDSDKNKLNQYVTDLYKQLNSLKQNQAVDLMKELTQKSEGGQLYNMLIDET